jgi:hypothetical protein
MTAYENGRQVDLPKIMSHELFPVPLSLFQLNGSMRTGSKSVLIDKLTEGLDCPQSTEHWPSRKVIMYDYWRASIGYVVGKTKTKRQFLWWCLRHFRSRRFTSWKVFPKNVVFDRYREHSIKDSTRQRWSKTHNWHKPIRRVIENRDVPLPNNWPNFMAWQKIKPILREQRNCYCRGFERWIGSSFVKSNNWQVQTTRKPILE